MAQSTKPISPLRQRMIDDMTLRQLQEKTQSGYLRSVKRLTRFLGRSPDSASAEDLRAFQKQLVSDGVSSSTINATIRGLRFFFDTTLERPEVLKRMSPVRVPDRLPVVLSAEDVARLLNAAPNLKSMAALSVAYGAGLRASEVCHLSALASCVALPPASCSRKSPTSTVNGGSSESNKVKEVVTAKRCSRQCCWSCYAPGGEKVTGLARCCLTVGYSRASIHSRHYRPANSIGCVRQRRAPRRWISASRCTPYAIALRRTCWSSKLTSGSSRCYSAIRS